MVANTYCYSSGRMTRLSFLAPLREKLCAISISSRSIFSRPLLRLTSANGTRTALMAKMTDRSEEHTSELQSLMRISYAVFCLKKKKTKQDEEVSQPNKQI